MTAPKPGRHLLVFTRDAAHGPVKTRLAPAVGAAAAAAVYQRMLRDTLATASAVPAQTHTLWSDRPTPSAPLRALARRFAMRIRIQSGPDLGARMHGALAATLGAADCAVLIGSDCPEYDLPYIESAFAALATHDAVLGPAADGGYVLIGVRRAVPAVFDGVAWGTDQVLQATRRRLRTLGWTWQELPTRQDVDEACDLRHFPRLAALADASRRGQPG